MASYSLSLNMLRTRRRLMLFLLLALSARVFTGAAEAQVSFTSLVADAKFYSTVTDHGLDSGLQISSPEDANPSPEKQRNTVTYKKYLTPENAIGATSVESTALIPRDSSIAYNKINYSASPLWVLRAHSPPISSLVATTSSAKRTYSLISWESKLGTSTIDNSTRGIGSL